MLCARAWKNDPYILEYGWGDHPQFFTAEVRKILNNARTLPSAAVLAAPVSPEPAASGEEQDDSAYDIFGEESPQQAPDKEEHELADGDRESAVLASKEEPANIMDWLMDEAVEPEQENAQDAADDNGQASSLQMARLRAMKTRAEMTFPSS